MEYTEGVVRDFLTSLVQEALAESPPQMSLKFAQGRFVKSDPATVRCTWPLNSGTGTAGRSGEFAVIFSGNAIETFVAADPERLAKLRAAAIDTIRTSHRDFDPADADSRYPFQSLIDRFDA